MIETDILIVGGGIIGLCIARELNNRRPDLKITLIEKRPPQHVMRAAEIAACFTPVFIIP